MWSVSQRRASDDDGERCWKFRLMRQTLAEEKNWMEQGQHEGAQSRWGPWQAQGHRPSSAACEATPESHSPGWARLVLRWGGGGFHFNRFFAFRHTHRHDANSAPQLGSDSYCPALDLLPDEFLDIGQVGVGFEFTPAGFVFWVDHRSVLSTGSW